MQIELRELMSDNEMLSHIFLGCIPREKLVQLKADIGDVDWQEKSVKLTVDLKIGGIEVNPKQFFNSWRDQMQKMILSSAKELVSEKLGSSKMIELQNMLYGYEQILKSWESDINWDVENPLK